MSNDLDGLNAALAARYPFLNVADREAAALRIVEVLADGITAGATPCLIGTNGHGEFEFATLTTFNLAEVQP